MKKKISLAYIGLGIMIIWLIAATLPDYTVLFNI